MSWLAIPYFFHLITTVIWLGGLTVMALFALPAWRQQTLSDNLWLLLQKRMTPWVNGSMAILWITGFIQMTNDTQYSGFLVFDSTWAWAMLAKHVAVIAMTVTGLYVQFRVLPTMERVMLLKGKQSAEIQLMNVVQQETRLLRLNLACAVLVLLFTAIATAT